MEAAPGLRGGTCRAPDLRHGPATHGHHRAAPPLDRRSVAPRTADVAGGVPAAAPAPRNMGYQPGFRAVERSVRAAPRRKTGIHGAAFHERRPGRGMLAT